MHRRVVFWTCCFLLVSTVVAAQSTENRWPRRVREKESEAPRRSRAEREVRDHRVRRGREQALPPDSTATAPAPRPKPGIPTPAEPLARPGGPSYFPMPTEHVRVELRCPEALVCPLDPVEDYLAWMLVRQTSIPYQGIVSARLAEGDWYGALAQLEVANWELYAALGEDVPRDDDPLRLELIEPAIRRHAGGIRLPSFRCEWPIVLRVNREASWQRQDRVVDAVDEIVADRIAEETAWCRDELLTARTRLGSWGRVARKLYLSPFLFEASFGIELPIDTVGQERLARYPRDEVIRDVADREDWPEVAGP